MMQFVIFSVLMIVTIFAASQANAEPPSQEEFMKTYQPKLDRVHEEGLPPTKQSEIGIHFTDIVCQDDKIHVLKLTGQNYIACVTPESASELVKRGWGLVHRENPHSGMKGSECTNWWKIHYYKDAPSKSKIIKTIRQTTNEFADEFVVWKPVRIVDSSNNTLTVSSHGNFHDVYLNKVIQSLSGIDHVSNVEHEPRGCI